jgi:hypothetical protein
MVNLTAPLNARQMEVLRWIADGCPDGVMKDFTYKTTAIALQSRRLVTIDRKRGIWRAEATEKGQYYLRHRAYPTGQQSASSAHRRPIASAAKMLVRPASAGKGLRPAVMLVRMPPAPVADRLAESLVARVLQVGGVSAWGAAPGLLLVRFPRPLAEPAVPVSR